MRESVDPVCLPHDCAAALGLLVPDYATPCLSSQGIPCSHPVTRINGSGAGVQGRVRRNEPLASTSRKCHISTSLEEQGRVELEKRVLISVKQLRSKG